jgi:hypothetical protein
MNKTAIMQAVQRLELLLTDPFLPLPFEQEIKDIVRVLRSASGKGKGAWFSHLPKHQVHSDTSREAAEHVAPRFGRITQIVYQQFIAAGHAGLTDEEGAIKLGMTGNSYRPCRVDLMDRGLVHDSGRRRKTIAGRNAVVWTVTDWSDHVFE